MGKTYSIFDAKQVLVDEDMINEEIFPKNVMNDKSRSSPRNGSAAGSSSWGIISIPFRDVARITVSLPLCGFIFCVIWAMYLDREAATYTHCGVNFYGLISFFVPKNLKLNFIIIILYRFEIIFRLCQQL